MFSGGDITDTTEIDGCPPQRPQRSQNKFSGVRIGPTYSAEAETMADTIGISKETSSEIDTLYLDTEKSKASPDSKQPPSPIHDIPTQQQKANSSKLKQQELPIWQPVVTVRTVLPALFLIGIIFIPAGAAFIYASDQVREVEVDYTYCSDAKNDEKPTEGKSSCADNGGKPMSCQIPINKDQFGDTSWTGSVFLYYGLENLFQNHRLYVKSRDDKQLAGNVAKDPDDNCKPFDVDENGVKIVPCGAIANNMFNDTITLEYSRNSGQEWENVPLLKTGIALSSDKNTKFANPTRIGDESLMDAFMREGNVSKPRDWTKNIWELDSQNDENNGFANEDFLVWMRTATLSNFRKLYRRVNHEDKLFENGLPKNLEYRINVICQYNVAQFEGRKKIILSTTSVLGAKNNFLGVMYVMTGTLCLLLGVFFLLLNKKYGAVDKQLKLKN